LFSSRLLSFRSLWNTHRRWRYSTAWSSCRHRHLLSASVNGTRIVSRSLARSCSQYSNTRNIALGFLPFTTLSRLTMFLWREDWRIRTSRSAVTGMPSRSLSMRTFFRATTSPFCLSLARYTTPYVPSPMRPARWNGVASDWSCRVCRDVRRGLGMRRDAHLASHSPPGSSTPSCVTMVSLLRLSSDRSDACVDARRARGGLRSVSGLSI